MNLCKDFRHDLHKTLNLIETFVYLDVFWVTQRLPHQVLEVAIL